MTDIKELGEILKGQLSFDKVGESLVWLGLGAGILYLVDKGLGVGNKLTPVYDKYLSNMNRNQLLELIDTIGDNVQLVDMFLKAMKVENVNLDKIADFLQNIATGSKYLYQLIDMIKGKIGTSGGIGSSGNSLGYSGGARRI